jgi:hypothetical protein
MTEPVLYLVQVLDQQVRLPRIVTQQCPDFGQCGRVYAPPFGGLAFSLLDGVIQDGDGNDRMIHGGFLE